MISIFILNSLALFSAHLLAFRIFHFEDYLSTLLGYFMFYFAQIIISLTALGACGRLSGVNVMALNLFIALVVWAVSRGKVARRGACNLKEPLCGLLRNKIVLLGAAVVLGFGMVKVWINLVNPPFGWDDISYHFVFPVEWMKLGFFDTPISICDDPSPPYYPINGSLFFLWFMLPLKNVFLADLGQVPFFFIALIAIYGICRKFNVSKVYSAYAALLFIITPNVFKQLEIAYVDVMVAALFLGALYFLFALRQRFSLSNTVAFSLYFGAFIGTKTSAIIYGSFLVFFFLAVVVTSGFKKKFWREGFIYASVFFLLTVALGGYTYIRNLVVTGNPLFPADISVFGTHLFKGVMPFATYRAHWTPDDFNWSKFLFGEGMGGQFIIFVLPSVLLAIPFFLKKQKGRLSFAQWFILGLPIALYLSFNFLMPQYWVRYLYPFLAAGFIVAGLVWEQLKVRRGVIAFLVFACIMASAGELSGHLELFISLLLSAAFFVLLPRLLCLRLGRTGKVVLLVLAFFALSSANRDYDAREFDRYANPIMYRSPYVKGDPQAWKWINDNTKGVKIAYAGIPHMLPLYGTHFKNDVQYVSVNWTHPVKLHYFPDARYTWDTDYLKVIKSLENRGNFRENPDYGAWRNNLHSENISYLVVYSFRRLKEFHFPLEEDWASSHPEAFEPAYSNDAVRIYKVKR